MKNSKKGFTLIELLVVVLIIGVLAAIALPMYQKAVLKSRFSALMPIVKSMNESNEAYYLEHNGYANNPQELPVEGKTEYPTGTELEFGSTMEYAYVLASNPSLNNHYIMYQKHSANYPGEIHCEALKTDKQANWVCEKGFDGRKIGGALTEGYNSYLLEGEGRGIAQTTAQVLAGVACEEGVDEEHCKVTDNADGSKFKKECTDPTDTGTCTWTTFNTDGTKTVCNGANNAEYQNGACMSGHTGSDPYEVTYDEDGNMVAKKQCTAGASSGIGCFSLGSYTYNEDGSFEKHDIYCGIDKKIGADGLCPEGVTATISDAAYNANGKITSSRGCEVVNSAECETYTDGRDYTYDAQGNQTSSRTCAEGAIPLEGKCSAYSSGSDSTYNAQGNQTSSRSCADGAVPADGNCTAYRIGSYTTYDENGTRTGSGSVRCRNGSVDSSGICQDGYWSIGSTNCDSGQVVNWGDGSSAPTCANPS